MKLQLKVQTCTLFMCIMIKCHRGLLYNRPMLYGPMFLIYSLLVWLWLTPHTPKCFPGPEYGPLSVQTTRQFAVLSDVVENYLL